jgi:hypothetical protein
MVEQMSSRQFVRALAGEFDRRGWVDKEDLALKITDAALASDELEADPASQLASDSFLQLNGISREELRAVLGSVFAGRVLVEKDYRPSTFIDNSVRIGDNNTISGTISVGGSHLTLTNNTPAPELLSAFAIFVTAATDGKFTSADLEFLDHLVQSRDDLDQEQLQAAARQGIEGADLEPGRLTAFRDAVITSASSGLAVQAILAAAGALL